MPRQSPEARGAASFLSVIQASEPAADLAPGEAVLWLQIVQAKPAGWFEAGFLHLLSLYVRTVVLAARVAAAAAAADDVGSQASGRLCRRLVALNTSAVGLASKLRLTVQASMHRRSGMLSEPGAGAPDPLRGGRARGH